MAEGSRHGDELKVLIQAESRKGFGEEGETAVTLSILSLHAEPSTIVRQPMVPAPSEPETRLKVLMLPQNHRAEEERGLSLVLEMKSAKSSTRPVWPQEIQCVPSEGLRDSRVFV
jgi:hypothetical protein